MKAIILSAGQGKRLLPITKSVPKSAVQINGKPILSWQIQELKKANILDVAVITGFGADIIEEIISKENGMKISTFYNPFFSSSDNLATCWLARDYIFGECIIINGDTLFEFAILEKLLKRTMLTPITLTTDKKESYDQDDMKIAIKQSRVSRVGKDIPLENVDGESIGIVRLSNEGSLLFNNEVASMMRKNTGIKQWYLSAINHLASDEKVDYCSINGLSWCEVDDQNDLKHAEKITSNWF